jgi:starch synthase
MSPHPLRVLFLTAEAVPFAKVGGLADVAGSLPQAIRALGHDVRLMMPRYGTIHSSEYGLEKIGEGFGVPAGPSDERAYLLGRVHQEELPAYFIWNDQFFSSRDRVYGFEDDAQRFALFSRAALLALRILDWKPDVIHANDWHTGLVPTWLSLNGRHDQFYGDIASLFTIHNLAYQGVAGRLILTFAQMEYVKHLSVEEPGTVNWMAQAIVHADLVSTVSRQYAKEILTPDFGMGLAPLLQERQERLFGVLNGLDYAQWDPGSDSNIAMRFDAETLERRVSNKTALQQLARLPVEPGVPLVGMVSRLDHVKGIDLMEPVLQWLFAETDAQFVLLGTGRPEYHSMFARAQAQFGDRMRVFLKFDEAVARRIYSGADIFLMPSAVEPCGLGQMIAMRYGCVPVVRKTGGLVDTVKDVSDTSGAGTGFVFAPFTAEACTQALEHALDMYRDRKAWRNLQKRVMARDFSWSASARKYVKLYRQAMKAHEA